MRLLWRWLGRTAYWLAWPALLIYLRLRARTRVLVVAEGHILLVQSWMSDARWGIPGGGLHRRERPAAGVVRETTEETGVRLDPAQLTLLASEWRSRHGLKFYCHFFAAELDTRAMLRKQRGEILAAQWFPLARLSTLPHKREVDRALELLAAHG